MDHRNLDFQRSKVLPGASPGRVKNTLAAPRSNGPTQPGPLQLLTQRMTRATRFPRRQDSSRTPLGGADASGERFPGPAPWERQPLMPGLRRENRQSQTYCFPHLRYTSALAQQLGIAGSVCLLEGKAARAKRSALARTRWRNSVRFHFLSAYSLAKRGLVDRKQWKFLGFLQGKG